MDTKLLRTALLVAQHGSFASAARVLEVDPSSVSRMVAAFEASLGVRLFQRSTRALAVTEAGESYLRRAGPLLDALDHAREEAARTAQEPRGTLRMTASVAFAQRCVLPHLPAFMKTYPDLTVELLPSDSNLDLNASAIDLAIRLAADLEGDLIRTRLMRTRYRVCAAPRYLAATGHPAQPSDLVDHSCLRFALPEYRTRWRFRKNTRIETVPVTGRLVISGALALRRAAIDGLGPALLADWLIGSDLAEGRLVDLFPAYDCTATEFDTAAWALYPSRQYLPRKVRVMIDFLRSRLQTHGTGHA